MTIPAQYNELMPYLMVKNAHEFLKFTADVFGATEQLMAPKPDGGVMHGELRIGSAVIMFSDSIADILTSTGLCLIVDDTEAVYLRGLAHGAVSMQEPEEKEYGKSAGFRDSFGNTWWLIEGMK